MYGEWLLAVCCLVGVMSTKLSLGHEPPEECRRRVMDHPTEMDFMCNLQGNHGVGTSELRLISENATTLHVQCNNPFESVPDNKRSFSHLTRFKELIVDDCNISDWSPRFLAGLKNLTRLTVRSKYNRSSWIHLESFQGLRQLEKLDLSFNEIETFSEDALCPLINLLQLNLSHNNFRNISVFGMGEMAEQVSGTGNSDLYSCTLFVQKLDLSWNRLEALPTGGFNRVPHLLELHLNNNEISEISVQALAALRKLQVLSLSNNKIVVLPPVLFDDISVAWRAALYTSKTKMAHPSLIPNSKRLRVLDLSHNYLNSESISSTSFWELTTLEHLDLSHNRLSVLEPTFSQLYKLLRLVLDHNIIDLMLPGTFTFMNNLRELVLSHNNIQKLGPLTFAGLTLLRQISLDNNEIEKIDSDAFVSLNRLEQLDLSRNRLQHLPNGLHNLSSLKSVDLSGNQIAVINGSAFLGLDNLISLELMGNELQDIPSKAFEELPRLRILNLAHNSISKIDAEAFYPNTQLQRIRLDANNLTDIQNIVANNNNLGWLNVSDNKLMTFDYSALPGSLEWLDLHGNRITALQNNAPLEKQLQLRYLDASYNLLTTITPKSIPNSIVVLLLNDNIIRHVESEPFFEKVNLSRVDLTGNRILNLKLNALRVNLMDSDKPPPNVNIGNNPFLCDCTMNWLNRVSDRGYLRIADRENVVCRILHNRRSTVPLPEMTSSQYLCTFRKHCSYNCPCCGSNDCDCEMTCPIGCSCYTDLWRESIADCTSAGYTQMPSDLPTDTTVLYIDGNNLGNLTSDAFTSLRTVRELYANNSNIRGLHKDTFSGLNKLEVLHLENNRLKQLQGFEFVDLSKLRELYLQGNRIGYMNNSTFSELKQLNIIRLDNNHLKTFEVWGLSLNPSLAEISLGDNDWSRDCEYTRQLAVWLQGNYDKVADLSKMDFLYDNATNLIQVPICETPVDSSDFTVTFICLSVFVVLTIVYCILYYRLGWIRMWLYSRMDSGRCCMVRRSDDGSIMLL